MTTAKPVLLFLIAAALPLAAADMRSAVFAAVVARSGQTSNCSLFSSMFAPDGVYESPVGSGWKVGPAAIEADCEAWNALIGPQGNGWYPGALYSSELGNRTSFTLQIRTVSKGGCKTVRAQARRRAGDTLCRGAPGLIAAALARPLARSPAHTISGHPRHRNRRVRHGLAGAAALVPLLCESPLHVVGRLL